MKKITLFFIILLSFLTLGAWNNAAWGYSYSGLTVNAVGGGTVAVTKSSSAPSANAYGPSSTQNTDHNKIYNVLVEDTYYIWVKPSGVYRFSGFSGGDLNPTWNNAGYYKVSFKGNTSRDSRTITATFVADFYGRADSYADTSDGGGTYVSCNGNTPSGANSYIAHDYSNWSTTASSAPKCTAYFAASVKDGYKFDGWYTATNKGGTKKSSNTTYSEEFIVNSTTSGSPTPITRYAHFSPVTVNSVDPAATSLTFTKPETKSVTLTFNVSNADAKADFNTPVISNTADWSLTSWSYANNQVTVVVSMTVTGNVTVKGAHNTTVTLTSKGASDNQSKTATINATVNMDPMLTCDISDNYMVDEPALDLNALWTSSSNATKTYSIVSFTPTGNNNEGATAPAINNNMLSLGQAGTLVLSIHQPQNQSFNEKSDTITISINKRVTAFSGSNYDKLVDAVWTADYSYTNTSTEQPSTSAEADFYYTIDAPNFDNTALNKGTDLISFDPATKRLTAYNAGATKITFYQKETYKYTGATAIYKVAVSKRANAFKCSWNTWQKAMNPNETVNATFTTTRADYANFPISIEQTFGENVATLTNTSATEKSITTTEITKGYAVWHLYQEEDYKYYPAEADVVVLVGMAEPPTCYVYTDNNTHEFSTHINDWEGHFDAPIPMTAPVDRIWFTATRQVAGANYFVAQYSVDGGSNWRDICNPDLDTKDKDFGPYSFVGLKNNERVTHIRFGAKQGATLTKWYKNIKVSRKSYLNTVNIEHKNINKLDLPAVTLGNSSQAKFYIDYSTCDGEITIESSDPHFTVSPTSVTANGDNRDTDKEEITVTYTSDEVGVHNGVITLTTSYQMCALSVSGNTARRTQQLTWQDGFNTNPIKLPVGLVVNDQNIAVLASSGNRVIYSTENPGVIRILNGGTEFEVIAAGTATLTAYEAGNDTWTDVTESRMVVATDKTIQEIDWAQSFPRFMAIGDVIALDAEVYLRNLSTGEKTYSAERTKDLSYDCPLNNGIISVSGNKMTILGYGEMTVTASVAGNEDYEAATPVTLPVIVRQPSAGCPTPYVLDYNNTVSLYLFDYSFTDWTTPELQSERINLSKTKGKPDKLSYQYEGEEYKIASITAFGGYIKVQQLVEGAWSDVQGSRVEAVKNTWKVMDNLQLNENATAIRFVREAGGKGTHNFKDIHISLLQYLRANVDAIELGDIKLGETRNFSVGFDYSDVKGDLTATAVRGTGLTMADNGAIDLSCGSHGHYDLSAALTPTVLGEWKDTIVIYDNVADLTLKVALHANIIEADNFVFEGNDGVWGTDANWNTGSAPGPMADVTINADVNITGNVTVNSLTINEGATVTLTVTGSLTVGDGDSQDRITYGDMHVLNGGQVHLGNGAVKVRNFILDAALGGDNEQAKSGQLKNSEQLNVNGGAYFQMSFDPAGKISYGWYDFTVPFEVNISGGIVRLNNDGSVNKVMVEGQDFLIMEDDEANFVSGGKGWKQFHSGVLQPGKLYTITFDDEVDQNTFRFIWDGNGNMNNGASFEAEYYTSTSDPARNGWNAVGNGMLRHGHIDAGYKMQAYDHSTNTYELISKNKTFAVGTAFFIQVPAAEEVNWTAADATEQRPLFAPKYIVEETEEFRLSLRKEDAAKVADILYFSASEEATEAYVIGHDLMKKGTMSESKKARLWSTKAGKQLCDIEATLIAGSATTPLFFFAPAAGQYEVAIDEMPEDANLYLTYNDQVIWDLTLGAYMLELAKGTTTGYGLRIEARTPQVATGIESTATDTNSARKVLINNTLYIVTPEGKLYDAVGKSVK